jgi:hypothetical protein
MKKNIKKDLYEIYTYLKLVSENDSMKDIYTKHFLDKFKYSLEEVSEALELSSTGASVTKSKKKGDGDLNKETSNISNISSLREFYYANFEQLFSVEGNEEYEKKVLSSITVEELKRLYYIISTIPIKKNKKKKDIIYMFKNYFDDESRTNDMNNKLLY